MHSSYRALCMQGVPSECPCLQQVGKHFPWAHRHPHPIHGISEGLHHVW